jgi:hypothetical protein
LARLQLGALLAVGLVASVALGVWAAAPPFLDQVGAAQLRTTIHAADREGDLVLTSRQPTLNAAKLDGVVTYVKQSGPPLNLVGRVLMSDSLCAWNEGGPPGCREGTPAPFAAQSGSLPVSRIEGRLPNPGNGEVAISRTLAGAIGVHIGSIVDLSAPVGGNRSATKTTVVGLFDPGRTVDPLWRDIPLAPEGTILVPGTDLVTLLTATDAARTGSALGAVEVQRYRVRESAIKPGHVDEVRASIINLISRLPTDQDVAITAGLPDLLRKAADNERSLGGPIRTVLALCLLLLGAAAMVVASLAIDVRREAIGLLKARGAGTAQIVTVFAIGLATAVAVALVLAPIVGAALASLSGLLPPLQAASGGRAFSFRPATASIGLAIPAAALIAIAAMVPFIRAARTTPVGVRRERARPPSRSRFQQAGTDLAIVVVAGILVGSLNARGLIFAKPGSRQITLDPLGVAAPAAALLAVGLLSLRVFAPIARACAALSARGRGVVMPLAAWEVGRDPLPRARLALLLVLAAGLGSYAAAYDATLHRAANDRAAFQVGADARRDLRTGGLDGDVTSEVWRGQVVLGRSLVPVATLGVDSTNFAQVAKWRKDFGAGSLASIIGGLTPHDQAEAVVLPDGARHISMTAAITSQAAPGLTLRPAGRVSVRVIDANGSPANLVVGNVSPGAGDTAIGADLPLGSKAIDAILFDPDNGAFLLGGFKATLRDVQVDGKSVDAFGQGRWQSTVAAQGRCRSFPYSSSVQDQPGQLTYDFNGGTFYDCPPAGVAAKADTPLPIVISRSIANREGWTAGQDAQLSVPGSSGPAPPFPVHISAVIDRFPTLAPSDQLELPDGSPSGFVLVDLTGIQRRWAVHPAWPAGPADVSRPAASEVWASGIPRLPDGTVGLLRRDVIAKSIADAPLQEALLGATVAGVILSLAVALAGLGAQLALSAGRRRRQLGVLRSIGVDRRHLLAILGVEHLLLATLALLVALPTGILLLRVLLPFIDLGGNGQAVVPPTRLVVPAGNLALLTAGILLATSVAVGIALVVSARARLHDVLRLGDD